jgi:hypothetical protein
LIHFLQIITSLTNKSSNITSLSQTSYKSSYITVGTNLRFVSLVSRDDSQSCKKGCLRCYELYGYKSSNITLTDKSPNITYGYKSSICQSCNYLQIPDLYDVWLCHTNLRFVSQYGMIHFKHPLTSLYKSGICMGCLGCKKCKGNL